MGFKKKLYKFKPNNEPIDILTQRTRKKQKVEHVNSVSIERNVRQLLEDKISGNMVGIWLLVPEHLKLGTWDLLCKWTNSTTDNVRPRLAMQTIHESALCMTQVRSNYSLSQKGFELANGLPFVSTDKAIHDLFNSINVKDTMNIQVLLGKLRKAS